MQNVWLGGVKVNTYDVKSQGGSSMSPCNTYGLIYNSSCVISWFRVFGSIASIVAERKNVHHR